MKNIILVLFVMISNNINQLKVNNTFVNYNSSTSEITTDNIGGVAFDKMEMLVLQYMVED